MSPKDMEAAAVDRARQRLDQHDEQLTQLRRLVDSGDVDPSHVEQLKTLKESLAEARQGYDRMQRSSGTEWEHCNETLQAAIDRLEAGLTRLGEALR